MTASVGVRRRFSHVAVLLGGLSAERKVSLDSGAACAAVVDRWSVIHPTHDDSLVPRVRGDDE